MDEKRKKEKIQQKMRQSYQADGHIYDNTFCV